MSTWAHSIHEDPTRRMPSTRVEPMFVVSGKVLLTEMRSDMHALAIDWQVLRKPETRNGRGRSSSRSH